MMICRPPFPSNFTCRLPIDGWQGASERRSEGRDKQKAFVSILLCVRVPLLPNHFAAVSASQVDRWVVVDGGWLFGAVVVVGGGGGGCGGSETLLIDKQQKKRRGKGMIKEHSAPRTHTHTQLTPAHTPSTHTHAQEGLFSVVYNPLLIVRSLGCVSRVEG
jgi:hypothetical protein